MSTPCPCGSGRPFADCCGPCLQGTAVAPSAEALMRSRYTAYTRHDDAYLLRTWHPSTRPAEAPSEGNVEWTRLQIVATELGGPADDAGTVEFIAHCIVNEKPGNLHEKSHFVRENGQWYYVDGTLTPQRSAPTPGRNDPCPCGSGRKYKKCCGA